MNVNSVNVKQWKPWIPDEAQVFTSFRADPYNDQFNDPKVSTTNIIYCLQCFNFTHLAKNNLEFDFD